MARYDDIVNSVNSRFEAATSYADSAWDLASTYLRNLGRLTPSRYVFSNANIDVGSPNVFVDAPPAPDRPDGELIIPNLPSSPAITNISVSPINIPDLNVIPPVYVAPDFPDDEMPDIPTDVPELEIIDFPTAPAYDLPTAPTFGDDISVPDPPDITLSTFDAAAPSFTVESPGNSFIYSEGNYSSELYDAAKAYLLNGVQNGGTGLDADVEQALIDRARARKALEHADKYDEAEQYFSGRGHTLPPGALSGRILNIQEQIGKEVRQQDDDILIEQARLAQSNTHLVIEKAISFESMALDHFNNVAQRAFEVARARQQAAMELFNAEVAYYNIQLEGYKTAASVYEIKIRAATLILEQYKLTLEGKQLQGELRKLVLEQYNLQLEGVKILYDLYSTEMNAAKIKSEVNATVIEAYRARIEAFNSIIGGITAKYNAYQTQLAGEQTKADVYKTQVEAYAAEVDAIANVANIDVEAAKVEIAENELRIERYKSQIEGYRAQLEGGIAEIETETQLYAAEIGGYDTEIKAAIAEEEAEIMAYEARVKHESNLIQQTVAKAEVAMQYAGNVYGIQVEQAKAGGNIAAQMTASALSSVSAGASYGYDEGVKTTYGYDQTKGIPSG